MAASNSNLHALSRFLQAKQEQQNQWALQLQENAPQPPISEQSDEQYEYEEEDANQFIQESLEMVQELHKQASISSNTNHHQATTQPSQPLALQVSDSSTIRSADVDGYIDDELVQLVQEHRCLWDTSSRSFKENNKKLEAWKNITEVLGQNG